MKQITLSRKSLKAAINSFLMESSSGWLNTSFDPDLLGELEIADTEMFLRVSISSDLVMEKVIDGTQLPFPDQGTVENSIWVFNSSSIKELQKFLIAQEAESFSVTINNKADLEVERLAASKLDTKEELLAMEFKEDLRIKPVSPQPSIRWIYTSSNKGVYLTDTSILRYALIIQEEDQSILAGETPQNQPKTSLENLFCAYSANLKVMSTRTYGEDFYYVGTAANAVEPNSSISWCLSEAASKAIRRHLNVRQPLELTFQANRVKITDVGGNSIYSSQDPVLKGKSPKFSWKEIAGKVLAISN